MPPTASTAKKSSRKKPPTPPAAPVANEDLEPLGPIFADDDDNEPVDIKPASPFEGASADEGDEEDDAPPVARNVGSLLKTDEDDDEPGIFGTRTTPAPTATAVTPKQGRPTPGQKPHAAALYWEEAKRIGPAHAKATLLRKLGERVQLHIAEVAKWGASDEHLTAAVACIKTAAVSLETAAGLLTKLPVGWTPPARAATTGPKTLPAGARVLVKEANRADYDGALEADEFTGLTVVKHDEGKSKVACRTSAGSRVVISRAHLALDDSPAPASEEETPEE